MLYLHSNQFFCLLQDGTMNLGKRGGADWNFLEILEYILNMRPSIFQVHALNSLVRRYWAFILKWYKCFHPFDRQQVTQAGEMLSKFYEDPTIFLQYFQSPFSASFVACLHKLHLLFFTTCRIFQRRLVAAYMLAGPPMGKRDSYSFIQVYKVVATLPERCAALE